MDRNVQLHERDRTRSGESAIPDRAMLTIAEVAAIFGVNHKTVRAADRLRAAAVLPYRARDPGSAGRDSVARDARPCCAAVRLYGGSTR
jgi:hypothetical protein